MALVCGLSESHFRRIFEESVGMTPMDYINIVRIEKACSLLSGTEQSVKEICFAVGYDTPSTFNRNFMKVTGKTPSQWKREHKNEGVDLSDYHVNIKKGWEAPGEQKDTPELFLLKGENVFDK
jgi:AraC-like DNA-binding protein